MSTNAIEHADLYLYKQRYLFLSENRIDVIHIDADPENHLPPTVQLQKATGECDPGTATPTYALLGMAATLDEAIDAAIATHAKEVE
jgi:hypothetical protein